MDCRGRHLRVVFPRAPLGWAGPDFLGAVLAQADGTLVRGDIEVHIRASNWASHRHARTRVRAGGAARGAGRPTRWRWMPEARVATCRPVALEPERGPPRAPQWRRACGLPRRCRPSSRRLVASASAPARPASRVTWRLPRQTRCCGVACAKRLASSATRARSGSWPRRCPGRRRAGGGRPRAGLASPTAARHGRVAGRSHAARGTRLADAAAQARAARGARRRAGTAAAAGGQCARAALRGSGRAGRALGRAIAHRGPRADHLLEGVRWRLRCAGRALWPLVRAPRRGSAAAGPKVIVVNVVLPFAAAGIAEAARAVRTLAWRTVEPGRALHGAAARRASGALQRRVPPAGLAAAVQPDLRRTSLRALVRRWAPGPEVWRNNRGDFKPSYDLDEVNAFALVRRRQTAAAATTHHCAPVHPHALRVAWPQHCTASSVAAASPHSMHDNSTHFVRRMRAPRSISFVDIPATVSPAPRRDSQASPLLSPDLGTGVHNVAGPGICLTPSGV